MVLGGSTLTTWAAAIDSGEICCCPVKAKCTCHDHDQDTTTPMIKKCGEGGTTLAPIVAPAIASTVLFATMDERPLNGDAVASVSFPDDRWIEPETPPF